jgi:hypothetical protein
MGHLNILLAVATLAATPPTEAAGTSGVIRWHAQGVQIYDCRRSSGGYAWALRQPDAVLTDDDGHVSGHHGAGPSWTATDGSSIAGRAILTIPAPRAAAIPWLVLQASTHDGRGTLEGVTYVLRTETIGGVAPADGCDPDHEGKVTTVPYQATYSFLHPSDGLASTAERPGR